MDTKEFWSNIILNFLLYYKITNYKLQMIYTQTKYIGFLYRKYDGKLQTEAWIGKTRLLKFKFQTSICFRKML